MSSSMDSADKRIKNFHTLCLALKTAENMCAFIESINRINVTEAGIYSHMTTESPTELCWVEKYLLRLREALASLRMRDETPLNEPFRKSKNWLHLTRNCEWQPQPPKRNHQMFLVWEDHWAPLVLSATLAPPAGEHSWWCHLQKQRTVNTVQRRTRNVGRWGWWLD